MSQPKELRITVTEGGYNFTHTGLNPHEILGLCELARVHFTAEIFAPAPQKPEPKQPDTSTHKMD